MTGQANRNPKVPWWENVIAFVILAILFLLFRWALIHWVL